MEIVAVFSISQVQVRTGLWRSAIVRPEGGLDPAKIDRSRINITHRREALKVVQSLRVPSHPFSNGFHGATLRNLFAGRP